MATVTDKPDYLASLPRDFSAGLVVFLVALPLCLGVALASGAPLISGIVAGVVGGILVAWVSGSHTSVSGPAAGLTAIVATQVGNLGSFEAFLVAVVLAGLFQIVLGLLKAGSLAVFFPSSVIKGLLAAIGIILILKQIPHLFGHDADWLGNLSFEQLDGENTFSELIATTYNLHPGAMVIGLVSLALLIGWDRSPLKKLPVPSALVVVVFGLAAVAVFEPRGDVWAVGTTHLVQVPVSGDMAERFRALSFPDFSVLAAPGVYLAALTVGIVATLETLLNLEATDKLDPRQRVSPPNRELVAQGVGNVASGLLGGLPITSVVVRSSVNISAGGRTRVACFFHGLFLLTAVLFFPGVLNRVPLACLAAILVATGYKLTRPAVFRQMWREGKNQFRPFLVTVVAIVLTDLLVGILIGMAVSIGFILVSNLRRPLKRIEETRLDGNVTRIVLACQVGFLNRAALLKVLNGLSAESHLMIDARNSEYIDADILDVIRDFERVTGPARSVKVSLVGFQERYDLTDRVLYLDSSTRELQAKSSPPDVLEMLQAGNKRFAQGEPVMQDVHRQLDATAAAQYPLAVVLACMDSRIATERIFDLGLGDLFSVRVAGNVAGEKELGSMEYGCAVAGAKLLLVLGHTRCGAVTSTVDLVATGADAQKATGCENLASVTDEIAESVRAETETRSDRTGENEGFVLRVTELNVHYTMARILEKSSTLRKLIDERKLLLIGGIYDLSSGRVRFLDSAAGPASGVKSR